MKIEKYSLPAVDREFKRHYRPARYSVKILMTSALSCVLRIWERLSADLNNRLTSAKNCRWGPVLFTGESVIMKMWHGS